MATITIPFPTKETLLGPDLARAASPPKTSAKPTPRKSVTTTPRKQSSPPRTIGGVGKPKQTKSRNGCATCKEKRLKCDETKPGCEQCKRRSVECGGYNKVFQWRPEEKATFRAANTTRPRRKPVIKATKPPPSSPAHSETDHEVNTPAKSTTFPLDPATDESGYAEATAQLNFDTDEITPESYDFSEILEEELPNVDPIISNDSAFVDFVFDDTTDLPYPSTDLDINEQWLNIGCDAGQDVDFPEIDFLEFVQPNPCKAPRRDRQRRWLLGQPSPPSSSSPSTSSSMSRDFSVRLKEPVAPSDSPEVLLSIFDRETCGILSIKDGPNENPWRTMLLPLAAEVPALHHAILSMTAFHAAREDPRYRVAGLRHSQKSIQHLGNRLNVMRKDAALATTLVLAFSESWDREISTGIRHLRAARKLVNQAIAHHPHDADFDELDRLKFLRNTWVYMDVIARITATEAEDVENLDSLFTPVYGPDGLQQDLDPLMGCASTLFPLLGRVANLTREIRRSGRISPRMMSKAASLRIEIWKWMPPSHLQQPEDESIEIGHSIKTAEAYRWATLLFLYQAVPMIATESLGDLAERVLYDLVIVPTSSRLVIVHIFPLLVAGCEMITEDNRSLVEERWMSMIKRMSIGNLDRCLDVIHEVWRRRDNVARRQQEADELALISDEDADGLSGLGKRRRTMSTAKPSSHQGVVRPDQLRRSTTDHVADIDPEMTVRGKCHWLTVMAEWDWAILL